MKKFSFVALTAMTAMASFTSCSSDENIPNIDRSFTDADGLTLTVNGTPMLGKTAKYVSDGNNAVLTLNSTFDLSLIPGVESGSIAGPGVIPGSPETVLKVPAGSSFSGSSENAYCTWDYSGEVSETALKLDITNLELKDKSIAGKWTPQPYNANDDWSSDEYGTVYSEPIYAVWESSAKFDFLGTPMPMSDILRLLMSIPLINNMEVSVPDALCASLKDVTFGNDGNITATYADDETEEGTPVYAESPSNIAQYVLTNKSDMRLFINPAGVIDADAKGISRAGEGASLPDFNNLLGNVIAQLTPMMSEGLPMHYNANGNELTVYLGTETLLPLLKTNVLPLLRDEAFVQMVVKLLSADEEGMGAMIAPMLPAMLKSAADVIEGTTKLEIGLNLKK